MNRKKYWLGLVLGLAAMSVFGWTALAAESEAELRSRLGIPAAAKSVIVFAQSSHVDPDWLLKADQYQYFTDRAFDHALEELKKDPRYVYSVECIFFFKRYWDDHPQHQEALRNYVNAGRIRFTGTGVTTPDTLLPEAENILRDYVFGRNWLRRQGMNIDPKLAYLPDDFGHSPTVPSILRELGLKYAGITRIDGVPAIYADWRPAREFPQPGTSAELLFKKLHTLDFIWQGPDGAEVLTHVNPISSYSIADTIDHSGSLVMLGFYLSLPSRGASQTNRRIDSYLALLRPLSPTGYMFCPLGGDFNSPVPNLNRILDNYNRLRYPQTGVYAVLAGFEDYMDLIAFHRDQLPVVKLDPNPLWSGFYSSRPGMKRLCRDLSRSLVLAETLGVMAEDRGLAPYPTLTGPWEVSLMSNHHDFITGTSRDEVLRGEQIPLLMMAQSIVDKDLADFTAKLNPPLAPAPPPLKWSLADGVLKAENQFYELELSASRGGCITRWHDRVAGREVLRGPSNDIVLYADSGGLYLMGMETYEGKFQEVARASNSPAQITAEEKSGVLEVTVASELAGHSFVRKLYLRSDAPMVRMKMKGAVKSSRTATVCFRPALAPGRFIQQVTSGVVERPLVKLYSPTFWAVKTWVDLLDTSEKFGVNLAVSAPGAVSANSSGQLEAVALRNAPMERSYGFPAIQTFVANGTDPGIHEFDYAFWPHGSESWLERRAYNQAETALAPAFIAPGQPDLGALAASLVTLDREDVVVMSVKKAESGDGVIVRFFRYAPGPVTVRLAYHGRPLQAAFRADALERELEPLSVSNNQVELAMPYALATVLLK